ncbi:MAG: ABC transporter substrate-binding protein [Pseudolabrys sp.]
MRRRDFIKVIAGPAMGWPLAARAQQSKKIPRLCFLTFDPGTLQATRFAFFEGLRDLGYVDGQSINIDYLSAEGRGERFPALAAECLRRQADIIAVSTTPAAQAAMNATRTTPIIMIALGDPVGTGLVDSLAQPGRNVTGMSMMVPEVAAKRLGLLKEAVPGISRVLVLTYLDDPIAPLQVKALKNAAPSLGVTLQIQDVRTGDDLPAAFEAGAKEQAEGLLTTAESMFAIHRAQVAELAARYRLPAMYCYSAHVLDAGGLMAYDTNYSDLQRRAATYVDRILKGAKPSDLPVQQPTKFEFVINLSLQATNPAAYSQITWRWWVGLILRGIAERLTNVLAARDHHPQPSSCTMIRLRWISSKSNWTAAAALAAATSGASTSPRISPLLRSRTTRQRRFIRRASLPGLSFLLDRRDGMAEI